MIFIYSSSQLEANRWFGLVVPKNPTYTQTFNVWYIFTYISHKNLPNVGEYTGPLDP